MNSVLRSTWQSFPGGTLYERDSWPTTFTPDEVKQQKNYYQSMPEEFYHFTGLTVVTPSNARAWCDAVRQKLPSLEFGEYMSGSGRLTLGAYMAGLAVSFPKDFRYGWDMRHKPHRDLLDEITALLPESVEFYAPKCGPWSQAQTMTMPQRPQQLRQAEGQTLSWTTSRSRKALSAGRGIIIEDTRNTTIFKQSPLKTVTRHGDVTMKTLDQCKLGAVDPSTSQPF